MGKDELQPTLWPPMKTRDGKPVQGGPGVMPGPADTYIAYGRNWANVSNTPFREYKHWVHEGGIATPLIVHWPAKIKDAGSLRKQPGHLIDVMATCIEISETSYPEVYNNREIHPMEGKSLLPSFYGSPIEREYIAWEHEANCAIRMGDWKLVRKGTDENRRSETLGTYMICRMIDPNSMIFLVSNRTGFAKWNRSGWSGHREPTLNHGLGKKNNARTRANRTQRKPAVFFLRNE
jgi:hypothetical protein